MLLAYFGHHKCACTWISDIMLNVGKDLGLRTLLTQLNVDDSAVLKSNNGEIDLLLTLSSPYSEVKKLSQFKGFHVIRDPRDICVSGYYSHLFSHPTEGWPGLEVHRQKLKDLSKSDGLMAEIEFTSYFLDHIANWDYSDSNIYELKMEDLTANPHKEFENVLQFLGLFQAGEMSYLESLKYDTLATKNRIFSRIMPNASMTKQPNVFREKLNKILRKLDFEKLAKGRKKGQEDVKSHYRKGVPGDWKNHFEERHIKLFKERYGELLIKLGYEKDLSW